MTFDRPPRERYVRATVEQGGYTFEPAVEFRDGDNFDRTVAELENIASITCFMASGNTAMERAEFIGNQLAKGWPGRAYFVEVWRNGQRGFAQIFQPFGVPRNSP